MTYPRRCIVIFSQLGWLQYPGTGNERHKGERRCVRLVSAWPAPHGPGRLTGGYNIFSRYGSSWSYRRRKMWHCESSVADPLSRISDPNFSHLGSRIRIISIPHPGSRIHIKKFKYGISTQKLFRSSQTYDPGCSSRNRILIFTHPWSWIQGSKRHWIPDPNPQRCVKI